MKGNHNSLVQLYAGLLAEMIRDLADVLGCSQATEVTRCIDKMHRRTTSEGIAFLTKTLPKLGKAFDKALQGCDPFALPGFASEPGSVLPKFLGWAFERIFNHDGFLKPNVQASHVAGLRQVLYSVYKLGLPTTEQQNERVITEFEETDRGLGEHRCSPGPLRGETLKRAAQLCAELFAGFDPYAIVPRHGPGAVATGEKGHRKLSFKRIYRSLEQQFPFGEYFCLNLSHVCDEYRGFEDLVELDSGTAKVVLVPKDSRGPRLISCEPLELQWIQQGIARELVPYIERHRLTRGHVNFTDQTINRRLALEGSSTGEWATLDMKEASDRVSLDLVKTLIPNPLLAAALACRSSRTKLPDGRAVELQKFAPMGSALCFPVESVIFWALSVAALMVHDGLTRREARNAVYVYGDDIIVRGEAYATIMQVLPLFALRFNEGKCCTQGFFRESCGCDAFRGVDVTPVKLRRVWSFRSLCADNVSYVDYSNQLWTRGFIRSALYLQRLVETQATIPFRDSMDDDGKRITREGETISPLQAGYDRKSRDSLSPYPAFMPYERHVFSTRGRPKTRFNRALHRLEVRVLTVTGSSYSWSGGDWSHLLRWFTNRSGEYMSAHDFAVPHRAALTMRWRRVL
jgi:hypothetical protein